MCTCLSSTYLLLPCLLLSTTIAGIGIEATSSKKLVYNEANEYLYHTDCTVEKIASIDNVAIPPAQNGVIPHTKKTGVSLMQTHVWQEVKKELKQKNIDVENLDLVFISPCGNFIALPENGFAYHRRNKERVALGRTFPRAGIKKVCWSTSYGLGRSFAILSEQTKISSFDYPSLESYMLEKSLFVCAIVEPPPFVLVEGWMRQHASRKQGASTTVKSCAIPVELIQLVFQFVTTGKVDIESKKKFIFKKGVDSVCWDGAHTLLVGMGCEIHKINMIKRHPMLSKAINTKPLPIYFGIMATVGGPWILCGNFLFNRETQDRCFLDKQGTTSAVASVCLPNKEAHVYCFVWATSDFYKNNSLKICCIHGNRVTVHTLMKAFVVSDFTDIEIVQLKSPKDNLVLRFAYKDEQRAVHCYKITLPKRKFNRLFEAKH